ncbi:MAG: tRNA guanosine(34) transglycosylase Tgt [Candidatus Campbellbacteria bacterium]|nr:tRNA guanosine(34) transglycosylase Tgt [Candidatus Campbellbacteria bacterium]
MEKEHFAWYDFPMSAMSFKVEKKLTNTLGRVGTISTPHGNIETPAFTLVGTKGTVKAMTAEQIKDVEAQVVLANTYHLYLEPGERIVEKAGGIGKFMNWDGPTITDSGGFQVMSLGGSFGTGLNKFMTREELDSSGGLKRDKAESSGQLARVSEDGVSFRSHLDGAKHYLTPERSIEIQHSLGADIIFAFDECPPADSTKEYQREAMDRTHRWAERCIQFHRSKENSDHQALWGIVQGGSFADLRTLSARTIRDLGFDGYGIGGSYMKEDLPEILGITAKNLEEEKPRHLLGIGEPEDFFIGIENGADTFDCVSPTRQARNGSLYTHKGRINIKNNAFRSDLSSIDSDCDCYTCSNYSRAYISHLFRSKEMLGPILATIHNARFIIKLVADIRSSIYNDSYWKFKENFLDSYSR